MISGSAPVWWDSAIYIGRDFLPLESYFKGIELKFRFFSCPFSCWFPDFISSGVYKISFIWMCVRVSGWKVGKSNWKSEAVSLFTNHFFSHMTRVLSSMFDLLLKIQPSAPFRVVPPPTHPPPHLLPYPHLLTPILYNIKPLHIDSGSLKKDLSGWTGQDV